ncbi:hypothetical protein D3C84_1078210 [compost metagenome]
MQACTPEPWALAVCYKGGLVVHVALVVEIEGRLAVLEINARTGARWQRIADFEGAYLRVRYYRDHQNLPEQA